PCLDLSGLVCGGWLMARQALAGERRLSAGDGDLAFLRAKIATARFFAEHFLAAAPGHLPAILGGAGVLSFDPDWF
ncbi:MAG: acyl-CoA dehydrogenase C-terminal domain-containing protein, partial [Stellaceae bacterium]